MTSTVLLCWFRNADVNVRPCHLLSSPVARIGQLEPDLAEWAVRDHRMYATVTVTAFELFRRTL